jgi:hypothetical protein
MCRGLYMHRIFDQESVCARIVLVCVCVIYTHTHMSTRMHALQSVESMKTCSHTISYICECAASPKDGSSHLSYSVCFLFSREQQVGWDEIFPLPKIGARKHTRALEQLLSKLFLESRQVRVCVSVRMWIYVCMRA